MTRRSLWCALLAVPVFLLAGCATIPGETLPQPADLQGGGNVSQAVPQPPKDEDPLGIVRGFVDNNADPSDLHAAARAYLAKSAQGWASKDTSNPAVQIIQDTFSTAYGIDDSSDPDLSDVVLHTTLVGTVAADGSFQPPSPDDLGDHQFTVEVQRQSDGQWRILNPPDDLIITQSNFQRYYRPVSVYFFSPGWDMLVPDQRYVVSDPITGLPGRIVQALLDGPSKSLQGAVLDAIPANATLKTNVTQLSNGQINVNLGTLPDQQSSTKQLIVAQIVRSLQNYGSSVAVESEGVELVQGHLAWSQSDVPPYAPFVGTNATTLVVSHNRIHNLADGKPIIGPAGNGTYDVVTAAESADGQQLATVTHTASGSEELRVGGIKSFEPVVKDLTATTFTRPTWEPSDPNATSRAVWTVADGAVVRVVSTQGGWVASPVDTSALSKDGRITDLRLSRDGVRVALVAGGHLFVGAVVDDQGSVSIKQVVQLEPTLTGVTKVDWLRQDQLVVATTQMLSISVDGMKSDTYSSANLTTTVTALAASQSGPVLAVDSAGIWSSTDVNDIWMPVRPNQPAGAIPFYPG
ncbi:MAG TPA: LpqB family beta-propeller domain-containing protein [Pseudonocardiaceae bacterium]|nr:LpqB family beta-propeller domain-containing protein [Pseudonocardiaceae bacterium]